MMITVLELVNKRAVCKGAWSQNAHRKKIARAIYVCPLLYYDITVMGWQPIQCLVQLYYFYGKLNRVGVFNLGFGYFIEL